MNNTIPKKIHYCWFGGNPLPEKDIECIESWKQYCPDYEIIQWDENNYDVSKNEYMYQAYQAKKWAFVSDYARLDIIYNYGGIYLDTDVEIIKPLDELIEQLNCQGFAGFEEEKAIALGLGFGATKCNNTIKALLESYNNIRFINNDGSYNLTPIPTFNKAVFCNMGFVIDGSYQVKDGFCVLPKEYLCPMNPDTGILNITNNTYSIHHYHASWKTETQTKIHSIQKECIIKYGEQKGRKIAKRKTLILRIKNKIELIGLKGTIKFILKKLNRH